MSKENYRSIDCPECGRHRVWNDGVCDKCFWDVDGGDYASITRPDEYRPNGPYDKKLMEKIDQGWVDVFNRHEKKDSREVKENIDGQDA